MFSSPCTESPVLCIDLMGKAFKEIIKWFGWEGKSKITQFQCPCHDHGYLPVDQVAQRPGLEQFQGWGIHYFSG